MTVLTICWICCCEEVKSAVKVRHVVILQSIASYAQVKKGRSQKECERTHRRDTRIEEKIEENDCVLDAIEKADDYRHENTTSGEIHLSRSGEHTPIYAAPSQ